MLLAAHLLTRFDPHTGTIPGVGESVRRLSELAGYFADEAAYGAALSKGDPIVYATSGAEPAAGAGDLHYALARLMPGRIGGEYYMTKGHYHAWRPAAEVYVGLSGSGAMLLEDEAGEESSLVPLEANSIVYVPGATAHRTINTGATPLVYLGVYPAAAGHDYGAIATRNFRSVVVEVNGQPTLLDRREYLAALGQGAGAHRHP